MKSLVFFVLIIASVLSGGATRTATATSTATPVVGCGFKLTVTNNNANNGGTLTLDPSAPIFHETCKGNGITIQNLGTADLSSFVLDCGNAGTITGSGLGTGIQVTGPSLSVFNCTVSGFSNGIVASGTSADIEGNTAQSSVRKLGLGGNGFVIKNRTSALNARDNGYNTSVLGNTAQNNAGYGFKISGNGIIADTGADGNSTSVFANLASGNLLGGFYGLGKVNMFGSLDNVTQANSAIGNGKLGTTVNKDGFGFRIVNSSCCFPGSLSFSQAISNQGPGILYMGPDDGSNCYGPTDGSPCYPSGLDLSPGDIQSFSNLGSCPKGWASVVPGSPPTAGTDGQICVKTIGKCSNTTLNNCP